MYKRQDRDRDRDRERQTDRQTDRQRQLSLIHISEPTRPPYLPPPREGGRDRDRQTDRQRERERQTDRDRDRERQTDRQWTTTKKKRFLILSAFPSLSYFSISFIFVFFSFVCRTVGSMQVGFLGYGGSGSFDFHGDSPTCLTEIEIVSFTLTSVPIIQCV